MPATAGIHDFAAAIKESREWRAFGRHDGWGIAARP
jgi:hypothetical protein